MGRHKKDCQCQKCVEKRSKMDNTETKQSDVNNDIVNIIVEEKKNESVDIPKNEVLFETPENQKINQENINQLNQQQENQVQKIDTIKPLVSVILPSLYNVIFDRMQVSKLSEQEEKTLVDSTSLVLAKYSEVMEFRYKEEVALLAVNVAIILPRLQERSQKLNQKEKEQQEQKQNEVVIESIKSE